MQLFLSLIVVPALSITYGSRAQPIVQESSEQAILRRPAQLQTGDPGFAGGRWRFDAQPSPNTTSNYVFETVASLLQQWPNTRYRNGHTIVPVTIPVGTLLYHGTSKHMIPTVPEWVATDPDHSYLFCRPTPDTDGCWHLTLAAIRPLKLVYFDGSSGAKILGTMDVQDILVWGKVQPERLYDEASRIEDLCQWGRKYGIDGFLRMALDFEAMICDLTSGLEVVSFLNLIPASQGTGPPTDTDILSIQELRGIEAGKWHSRFPGEIRAKLDLTRLVSLYDTDLFPSLVEARHGQERWDHRVEKIGKEDRNNLLRRLDDVMGSSPEESGSGVDWASLIRVIIHRYADRLEVLQYMLNNAQSENLPEHGALKGLRDVHEYVASMISSYIINHVRPGNPNPGQALNWAAPVFRECATTHTKVFSNTLLTKMTRSELLILGAVKAVSHEICRVVVSIWANGVVLGLGTKPDVFPPEGVRDIAKDWGTRIDWLIRWLDWSVWVKCRLACGIEETCYLPTWPWLHDPWWPPPIPNDTLVDRGRIDRHQFHTNWDRVMATVGNVEPGRDDDECYWRRPQPRCIRRIVPLEVL